MFTEGTDLTEGEYPAWHEIHIERREHGPIVGKIDLFALGKANNGDLKIDINPDPNLSALNFSLADKSSTIDRLKEKLAGQKTGWLQSSGDNQVAGTISYSIEVHELD